MLATGGSPHSLDAAKKAAQTAKSNNSHVVIVRVLEIYKHITTPLDAIDIVARLKIDDQKAIKQKGNEAMAATKKISDNESVKTTTRFLAGDVSRAIINEAAKEKVNLITVAATGHGVATEWLLGSVAEKIARYE